MEDNQTPNEPESLLEQFGRLEWALRRRQLRRWHAHGPMATPHRGQGRILSLLRLKPEISQKELGDILDIRPQSLGELLSKLEKAGYIERTPSETDKRGMNIRLTDAGREAAEQPTSDSEDLFSVLTDEERTNLSAYFAKILEAIDTGDEDFERGPQGRPGFGHGHPGFDREPGHGPHFHHGRHHFHQHWW